MVLCFFARCVVLYLYFVQAVSHKCVSVLFALYSSANVKSNTIAFYYCATLPLVLSYTQIFFLCFCRPPHHFHVHHVECQFIVCFYCIVSSFAFKKNLQQQQKTLPHNFTPITILNHLNRNKRYTDKQNQIKQKELHTHLPTLTHIIKIKKEFTIGMFLL